MSRLDCGERPGRQFRPPRWQHSLTEGVPRQRVPESEFPGLVHEQFLPHSRLQSRRDDGSGMTGGHRQQRPVDVAAEQRRRDEHVDLRRFE